MPKLSLKPKPLPSDDTVNAALQCLNSHYAAGKRMIETPPSNETERDALATEFSISSNYSSQQKARQIAELLNEKDWTKLTSLRIKRTKLPLGWGHCVPLASSGTATKLLRAAELAANEGWSAEQIRQYLQREAGQFSRRRGSGPRIRKPTSLLEGLQQLLTDIEVVRKRVEVLRSMVLEPPRCTSIGDKLVVLSEALTSLVECKEVREQLESGGQEQGGS